MAEYLARHEVAEPSVDGCSGATTPVATLAVGLDSALVACIHNHVRQPQVNGKCRIWMPGQDDRDVNVMRMFLSPADAIHTSCAPGEKNCSHDGVQREG